MLLLVRRQDLGDVAFELGVAQLAELDRHEIAVHAQHRRYADGQMDIRAALLGAELQERINARHCRCPLSAAHSGRSLYSRCLT